MTPIIIAKCSSFEYFDKPIINIKLKIGDLETSYQGYSTGELEYLEKYLVEILTKVYNLGDNHGWNEGYSDCKEDYNVDG